MCDGVELDDLSFLCWEFFFPDKTYSVILSGFCEDSGRIANGEVTYTYDFEPPFPRRPYGTVVTYSCNSGFVLSEGSGRRTCENGVWNGALPMCELECELPLSLGSKITI